MMQFLWFLGIGATLVSAMALFIVALGRLPLGLADGAFRWRLWRFVLPMPLLGMILAIWPGTRAAPVTLPGESLPSAALLNLDAPGVLVAEPVAFPPDVLVAPAQSSLVPLDLGPLILGIWALGAVLALLYLAGNWLVLARMVHRAVLLPESAALARELRLEGLTLGIRKAIPIGESRAVAGPVLCGILRPVLLVPPGALANMDAEKRALVLQHECQHVHNKDNLVSLYLLVLGGILWFCPLLWFARRHWEADRELACDQRVLASMKTKDVAGYARLILDFASTSNGSKGRMLACQLGTPKKILKRRFEHMFAPKSPGWFTWVVTGFLYVSVQAGAQVLPPLPVDPKPNSAVPASSLVSAPAEARQNFAWPLAPGEGTATLEYGQTKHPLTGEDYFHHGLDIALPSGRKVLASAGGTVVFAALDGDMGNEVIVDHGKGYRTVYAKLQDIRVKLGDMVLAGDVLGHSGNTGLSTGPHLHFEVWKDGTSLDPRTVLPPWPSMAKTN